MSHHIIFEGAELAGKSWIMSEVYKKMEQKYGEGKNTLNGCHWFNCDNGVFGGDNSDKVLKYYFKIFESLANKNLILEKYHLSDKIYQRMYRQKELNYDKLEKKLKRNNFRLVLIKFPEDKEKIKKRIQDRLNLYPHYRKILKSPEWYIKQQAEYQKEFEMSCLDKISLQTDILPDYDLVDKLNDWIYKNS